MASKFVLGALCALCVLQAAAVTVPATTVTTDTRACLPPHDKYPFCDTSLALDKRVRDLIDRLEDEEKPPLLTAREGGGGNPGPPGNVSRIGLPEYDWGLNCIHGVASSCVEKDNKVYCPTTFPNPVTLGASFNDSMFAAMGRVIGVEARALWLAGATEYSSWSGRPHIGLDCWSPNININRDPRWGRNQEVPSEDPYLNGQFGKYYTQGLQKGDDSRYLLGISTLKHWDAYSLEDADGFTRHNFNAAISDFALQDTYFPAFEASVVDGGALGVMCSYNAINGKPTCASSDLTAVLRGAWKFEGFVTSDTGALADIYQQHKYVATVEEAACVALVDGQCDMNSGGVYHDGLLKGVSQGNCSMDDVDNALFRTLKLRFQLGLFDPIDDQPYWNVPLTEVDTDASRQLSLLSTLESLVLLKNNNTLPFKKGSTVAVVGPHINTREAMVGNYAGQICAEDTFDCIPSPLEMITKLNANGATTSSQGCAINSNDTSGFADALAKAKQADYVVALMGLDESMESESHDRTSISMPGVQHQFLAALANVGKPVALVLINGGMVALDNEAASMGAILSTGYPGFEGAQAIAMTLFGDNDHLGGKLPYTIYPASYVNDIKMSEMEMNVGPGRTYRYYKGVPTFPFGYGISLTSFAFSSFPSTVEHFSTQHTNARVVRTVTVSNTGSRAGDEVVLGFVQFDQPASFRGAAPTKKLVAYKRVHLAPGESVEVELSASYRDFCFVRPSGDVVSSPGLFSFVLTNGVDQTLRVPVSVHGDEVVVQRFAQERA